MDIEKIITRYIEGETISNLSRDFKISRFSIREILKKNKIYGKREREPNFKKYVCNNSFFYSINNAEKAYWLGFIAADGYIQKGNKRLTIELHIKDIKHLRYFTEDISSNHPVKIKNIKNNFNSNTTLKKEYYTHCLVQIWSPLLVLDIVKHGVTNKKSLTLLFPDIEEKYINSFMLGYFDGDGCWSVIKNKTKKEQTQFRVTGNYEFLIEYQKILMQNCNLKKTKLYEEGNVFTLKYSGNQQCSRIYQYLYGDSKRFLQRKIEKIKEILK